MSGQIQYNFCPNCGSAMTNGVCGNCGFTAAQVNIGNVSYPPADQIPVAGQDTCYGDNSGYGTTPETANSGDGNGYGYDTNNGSYGNQYIPVPPPKSNGTALVILFAVIAILLIGLFVAILQTVTTTVVSGIPDVSSESTTQHYSRDTGYTGKLADYLKAYRKYLDSEAYSSCDPSEYDYYSDPYYVFDDYINSTSGYNVILKHWSFYNDDGWFDDAGGKFPRDLYIFCDYVSFTDTPCDASEIDTILYGYSTELADMYESFDYECGEGELIYLTDYIYVTYMDSDVASVLYYNMLFVVSNAFSDEEEYKNYATNLVSVNIDMKTGRVIDVKDVYNLDSNFVDTMIKECHDQNDGLDLLEYFTRDELINLCKNGEIVWFYTPLGVEFGVNFPNGEGFCTFTCTDINMFKK